MKIKNYALCALLMSAFTVINCDDGNSVAINDDYVASCNEATSERCLYAKVENASEYSDIVDVRLMVGDIEIARGNWVGDGFTIELPETVDASYLRALDISPPTMTVSNNTARMLGAFVPVLNEVHGIDRDGNIVVVLWPYATNGECARAESAFFYYTYADSDVVISGYTDSIRCMAWQGAGLMENPNAPNRKTFSIEWKKGWNLWVRHYTPFWEFDEWNGATRAHLSSCEEVFSTDSGCEIVWREARYIL